jgi:hypothetical protein
VRFRDLFGGLPRVLQDAARLFADAVEVVADRGSRRAADLQLGDHGVDALDVGIDRLAAVAADRCREDGSRISSGSGSRTSIPPPRAGGVL